MANKLSRRDFLKLSGVASVGMLLSACGIDPTQISIFTNTPSPTETPSPSDTPMPTTTPIPPTLRTVGEKLGIVLGTTVDGAEEFDRAEYRNTAGTHFSSIFPGGTFLANTIENWGLDMAKNFRDLANRHSLILHIHPVFWHQDITEALRSASKDDVVKFMESRIRTLLKFVNKTDQGHRATFINFINEPLRYWPGHDKWEDSPYYRTFGDQLIIQTYLILHRIAEEMGLITGKDFRLIYNDYDIFRPNEKTEIVFSELARAKTEIAKNLEISENDVQLDVGIQYHLDAQVTPTHVGYFTVPTDEEMVASFELFSQIGRIHVTEFDVAGATNQDELMNIFNRVTKTSIKSGLVDSINYWNSLRVFETSYDRQMRESGREVWFPNGLFDKNYQPTVYYYQLLNELETL